MMTPARDIAEQLRAVMVSERIADAKQIFLQNEENLANRVAKSIKDVGLTVLVYLPSMHLDDAGDVHEVTVQVDVKSNPCNKTANCGYDVAYLIFKRFHNYVTKEGDNEFFAPLRLRARSLEPMDASLSRVTFVSRLNDN